MSWVEDARKLMQDFVAPELRAISVRLDAADKLNQGRDRIAAERHATLLDKLEANRRELMLHVELTTPKSRTADYESGQKVFNPASYSGVIRSLEGGSEPVSCRI